MKRRVVLLAVLAVLLAGGAAWAWPRPESASPILYRVALGQIPAALAVDTRTARVFAIARRGGASSMLDARDGAVLASIPVYGSAVAVDERAGTVLVAGDKGLTILDAATGRVLHIVAMDVAPAGVAVDARSGHAFVADPGSDTVLMLDTRTGAILRSVPMLMTPLSVTADPRSDQIFVASESPFTAVLDARSGTTLRTLVARTPVDGIMAVGDAPSGAGDGHAWVAAGGVVSMLDTQSGAVVLTSAVGQSATALAVDGRRGRAYVVTRSGSSTFAPGGDSGALSVLDTRSGAVLKTISVGVAPTAVAVDESNGHVFVATGVGAIVVPDAWRWLPDWLRRRLPFLPPPGPHLRLTPPGVDALAVAP